MRTPIERWRGQRLLALTTATLVSLAMLAGCSKPEPYEREEPEPALEAFLVALEINDLETAWDYLMPADKDVLEVRAEALAETSDGAVELEPWEMLRPGHVLVPQFGEVERNDEASTDEVTVMRITQHDGRESNVSMVHQDGRWYVDLPLEQLADGESE